MDTDTALALEIYDALMVLCPRGWVRATVRLAPDARGGVRVAELTSEVGAEVPARPELGLERGAWMGALNEALGDLSRTHAGWDGAGARLSRAADGTATLALLDARQDTVRALALGADDQAAMVFTEAFFDAVAQAERALEPSQRALLDEIAGHDEWNFDQATGRLALAKGVLPWRSYRVDVLGSLVLESGEFLWAWANPSLDPALGAPTARLRDQARAEHGLAALLRPALPTGDGLAYTLAMVAAARLGARGVYPAVYGPGVLFFAVWSD